MREFACKVFFSFSVLKKVLFQNLTCQMQDAAYLLMHLVHWCWWYSLSAFYTARCKLEIFLETPLSLVSISFYRAQLLRQGLHFGVKKAITRKAKALNVLVRQSSECWNKRELCLCPSKSESLSSTRFCLMCLYSCTYD